MSVHYWTYICPRPLGLRDWQAAQQRARDIKADGLIQGGVAPTIEDASEKFLSDAKARQLREPTIYKYRLLLKQLKAFATDKGLVFISDFDPENTRLFRESWTNRGTAGCPILRRFCEGWGSS
jgi:hypothetical protein